MSELELLKLAKNGDEKATDELMSSYKFLVTIISRKYFLIGGEREDLVQEGMIGLYRAIRNFSEEKGTFKAFAKVCIENQIVEAIRKTGRQKSSILNGSISLENGGIENLLPTENVEEYLIEKENKEERFRKINKLLTSLEKKVLDEYLEGFSYLQIAQNLNISPKLVDNAISRIKIKLKTKAGGE